jgi:PleD family two-component response regulator
MYTYTCTEKNSEILNPLFGLTVLVVDDAQTIRKMASSILGNITYVYILYE